MAEVLVFLAFAALVVAIDYYLSNSERRDARRRNMAHRVRKE